ncbi:uncharacterized protein [Henckelia pumila]|uniref:uncharacterized protein isoform X2 n=1 Tax=Henckelia pumila TaxID=405737 RepID=UPI003C6E3448
MGVAMHAKSDSEVTSIEASTPPRSPRRPLYYVQSPSHSQHDLEKMSYGSSPFGSPTHHFQYHCSPIHHSRESSTSRYSASLKNPGEIGNGGGWRRIQRKYDELGDHEEAEDGEEYDEGDAKDGGQVRFYAVCFVFSFVALFTTFSLILWGASLAYKPNIIVKNILFENFNVQAGMDNSGVPTDMLSLNSTVKIFYRNPSTFFGVHVTSTPLQLYYFDLKVASDEQLLPVPQESANRDAGGRGASGAALWRDPAAQRRQRPSGEHPRAAEPDVRDAIEGLHSGEAGED